MRQIIVLLAVGLLMASCGATPSGVTSTAPPQHSTTASESAAPLAQTAPPDRASEQGAALAVGDVELQIHDMLPKSLVVRSDGTITLTEGDHSERETVAPRELAELNRAIEDSDFSALQQDYPGTICCDFIAHTITVTTPGRTHTVYCYNECPEAFDRVKDAILRLWPGTIEYQGWA